MTDKIAEDLRERYEAIMSPISSAPKWVSRPAQLSLKDEASLIERISRLEAENRRLAEELETSNANHRKMASEMAALGEENKRLRKCADA